MAKDRTQILIIGYFGYVNNQLDGQTVKTRDIKRLLEEQNAATIEYYDTQEFQQNKLSIFKMLRKLYSCDTLIYLPGQNNLKNIFPIVYLLSKLLNYKIHYFVVGGWLSEFLSDKPSLQKMLRKISGIHVETKRLMMDLEHRYNYKNVDIFPNFRFPISNIKSIKTDSETLRLVFVSRVCESKGLDTLKKLYYRSKANNTDKLYTIDFFGQITDNYYDNYLKNIPNYHYKGVLQPNEVISTLQQYDALIFPTHYEGEGCPGILIESLFAGLPIIASNWKYNNEFVLNGINGILCETYNVAEYETTIINCTHNPNLLTKMSKASREMAINFSAEMASQRLITIIHRR